MTWTVYTRVAIPLYRLSCAIKAIHDLATELNVSYFKSILYATEGDSFWWAWDTKEIEGLGMHILGKTKTEKGRKTHFSAMKRYFDKAITSAERVRTLDLAKLGDEDIIKEYSVHYHESSFAHTLMDTYVDAIDVLPAEILKQKIKEALPKSTSEKEFIEAYTTLSTPAHTSYILEEENELLKVILRKTTLAKVIEKYWWTSLGWECMTPKSKSDFLKLLQEHRRSIKDPEKKLKENQVNVQRIKKERDNLLKKYSLSEDIQNLIELFDTYARYHDLRKEMQVKTTYSFYLLLQEVAKRTKQDIDDLEWLWHDEVCDLLRTRKSDKQEIKRRKQALLVLSLEKGIRTYSGREAIRVRRKELDETVADVDELKGMGVSPGIVKARVKVCNGSKEAATLKKGEILVTGMTLPDYVPAMKRAAAIVTDEGGITCHAAIISRELKKPCIVGTKIATKVLSNGDLVEVDANKGIVRKIK